MPSGCGKGAQCGSKTDSGYLRATLLERQVVCVNWDRKTGCDEDRVAVRRAAKGWIVDVREAARRKKSGSATAGECS